MRYGDPIRNSDLRVNRQQHAFTIPEMLAVVALIVIIISILQPAIQKGRTYAREAMCNSNLHQIGLGSRGYATDERYLPPSYLGGYAVWPAVIRQYTNGNTDVFYCPEAPREAKWEVTLGSGLPAEWGYAADEVRRRVGGSGSWSFSYGHNNDGTNAGLRNASGASLGVGDPFAGREVASATVVAPSNFMLISDSLVDGVWDHFIDEDVPGEEPATRHHGGAYVVFGDAHTEWINPEPYLDHSNTGANDPALRRRWNNDNKSH